MGGGNSRSETFRKDRRLNIRISTKDLEAIKKRALEEGFPYHNAHRKPVAQVRVRAASDDLATR